jgi:multiple sugar transport system substrate-binding protein
MFRKYTTVSAIALTLVAVAGLPARADVSIMYADWLSALVEPGIANFEKATGEKVTATKLPGDGYVERVALDLSSGTAADVIQMDSFVVSELASSNYLQSLDDTIGTSWDQYKYYVKGLLDVASYNGHVYGLPTDTDVRMLWYNKADFAKAGIAVPWAPKTWQDVLDTAAKVKAAVPAVENALVLPAGTKQGEGATMQGFYMLLLGADKSDGDRNRLLDRATGQWIGDSPGIRRTLDFYHQVYIDKKLGTSAINYATDVGAATRAAITSGTAAIVASGSWENACFWDCNGVNLPSQAERDKIVGWTPWPGSGQPGAMPTTNISGGWTIGINAKAANKASAQKLIEAIFDKANFLEWTVKNHRMGVRTDITGDASYTSDPYMASITSLAATTTGRDTVPGYQDVSSLVQHMTADILDGKSIDEVVKTYNAALVDEFGADKVITYK